MMFHARRARNQVLGLLQRAWDARVLFAVGTSITTGKMPGSALPRAGGG